MTDDEELIERLRRTLHSEAAAITPSPEGHPAAPYPAPVHLRLARPRWPLALVAAAVAAAVVLAAVNWPGGSRRVGVVTPATQPTGGPSTVPSVTPSTRPGSAATVPTEPTTVPAVSATPVPAGFAPAAGTFVSAAEGWAAGTVPCGSSSCLALTRTLDGGLTWSAVPAPGAGPVAAPTSGSDGTTISVRFADPMDGWIFDVAPPAAGGYDLWSTHDGGYSWQSVDLAAFTRQSEIVAIEASGGRVQVVVLTPGSTIHVDSSPVAMDAWTDTDTGVQVGAGPVPSSELVLQRTSGWLLENDRTVEGGASLNAAGGWSSWTAPCATANGSALLAASNSTNLVAVCDEGVWGPPDNLPAGAAYPAEWLFQSSDGGASFQAVGPLPSGSAGNLVATPAPATIVVSVSTSAGTGPSAGALSASFNGGHTWQTVYQGAPSARFTYLGFTTLTQGVAIESLSSGSLLLLMTRDGGHSWAPVSW